MYNLVHTITRNYLAGATVFDAASRVRQHLTERCFGCGLCTMACDQQAIQMEANPAFRRRPETIASTLPQSGLNYLRNVRSVWRKGR